MLHEKGLLDFEDFIAPYLLEDIISDLHVLDGEDYSDVIRIKHLLNHTSGLPDYFTFQPESGSSFIDLLLEEPSHFWPPEEMIQFSKENLQPLFSPGDGYHYSDTNYQLLGLIIEKVTGKQLHEVFQEYIWEPLEMSHTYLHLRSEPSDPSTLEMSHMILNGVDVTNFTSLSAAWADGGIVSTVEDLRTFMYSLLHNLLIQQETMQAMQDWIPDEKGIYYGFGFMLFKLPELSPFLSRYPDIWGHAGSTGSYLYYCPELDTVLAGTMNQSEYAEEHINVLIAVLDIIASIN
jgi:CubicO group peptidase (beta-lactamase class C family)